VTVSEKHDGSAGNGVISVGPLRILLATRDVLLRDGSRPKLAPKVLDLLIYLAERADQVVSKEQLFDDLWAGRVVEANALNQVIFQARLALDDPNHERLITYPKRGFLLKSDARAITDVLSRDAPTASATAGIPMGNEIVAANEAQFGDPEVLFDRIIQGEDAAQVVASNAAARSRVVGQTPANARWKWLPVLLASLALTAGIWWWVAHRGLGKSEQFDGQNQATPAIAESATLANADIFVSADFAPELQALFQAAAIGAGKRMVIGKPSAKLVNSQFSLSMKPGIQGVLLDDAKQGEFFPEPWVLSAFLAQIKPGTGPVSGSPFIEQPQGTSVLAPLFQSGTRFEQSYAALLKEIERAPFVAQTWLDAKLLLQLSGKSASAAMLQLYPGVSGVSGAPEVAAARGDRQQPSDIQWLAEQVSLGRAFRDQFAEAKLLQQACTDVRIQNGSWMHGACLIEQAMAERRANLVDQMLASLALATSAFNKAGDAVSAALTERMAQIAFKPGIDDDVSSLDKFEDARAIGLLMRPMVMTNPALAHASATKVWQLSWVRADRVANFEVAQMLSYAARRLDDRQKMTEITGEFESMLAKAPDGSLKIAILEVLMNMYYARGDLTKAITVRRQMESGVGDIKLISRCRSAVIFLEAEEFALSKSDADVCFDSRFDKAIYTQFSGTYAWVAKIQAARLQGDLPEANQLLIQAINEYEKMLNDQSLDTAGHQSLSNAAMLFNEAWALGRWDVLTAICAKPQRFCEQEWLASVMKAKDHPEQLNPIAVPAPDQALSAPELLTMLYLEQRRLGHCPIDAAALEKYIDRFRGLGSKISLVTLEKMRKDCVAGQVSSALDQFQARLTN
jgi:DNA-binding winged helix-turn-helix (wHTH) protein